MPKKKEKRPKKATKKEKEPELKPVSELLEIDLSKPIKQRFDPNEPVFFDLTLPTFEKDLIDQQRDRVDKLNEKKSREEVTINKKRLEIRNKTKEILKIPGPPKYQPLEPVQKSAKLKEFEKQIKKGKFFEVDHKKYLKNFELQVPSSWKEPYVYRNTFDSVGLERHLIWKSVY